eukprot:CAMPEP_0114295638 /NCGR_PEP_ID=MMETSP0059-20121206/10819_1 /TAXON_ID=36894 /ORGANISM="Pyramimonas parkeae, Strain CCMP726" /LENGTH=384 /DNA_ID=CAMNT_0001417601 /DNA_START=359 /DNA_END=1513 /DNA_ORIENTATION=+
MEFTFPTPPQPPYSDMSAEAMGSMMYGTTYSPKASAPEASSGSYNPFGDFPGQEEHEAGFGPAPSSAGSGFHGESPFGADDWGGLSPTTQANAKDGAGWASQALKKEEEERLAAVARSREEAQRQKAHMRQMREQHQQQQQQQQQHAQAHSQASTPQSSSFPIKPQNEGDAAKAMLATKLQNAMPSMHSIRPGSASVPGIEARKAQPREPCNRYCSLECICRCIAAVLSALDRPELKDVSPTSLTRDRCRIALKKAKVAFHPDKCHGDEKGYHLEVSKTINELEMRLQEVTSVTTLLKMVNDASFEVRMRVDMNCTVAALKQQITAEVDSSLKMDMMVLSIDGSPMIDDKTLASYGVKDMTVFHLTMLQSPGTSDWAHFGAFHG